MDLNAQHWQTRTPLRVRVLGLLFGSMVLAVFALLWSNWGLALGLYLSVAACVFALITKALWHDRVDTLCFDSVNEFGLLDELDEHIPVHISRVWQSPLALIIQIRVNHNQEKKQLVFWRGTLSASRWRTLHIHLWRYQLQYQFSDLKGAQ